MIDTVRVDPLLRIGPIEPPTSLLAESHRRRLHSELLLIHQVLRTQRSTGLFDRAIDTPPGESGTRRLLSRTAPFCLVL